MQQYHYQQKGNFDFMRKFDTKTRVLLLYMLLLNNIPLSKQELELLFDVDYRTIDRDISAIRNALAESKTIGYSLEQYYLDYDRNQKKYVLGREQLNGEFISEADYEEEDYE